MGQALWLWLVVLPALAAAQYLWDDGSTAADWLPDVVRSWTTAVAVVLSAVGAGAISTARARVWTESELDEQSRFCLCEESRAQSAPFTVRLAPGLLGLLSYLSRPLPLQKSRDLALHTPHRAALWPTI